MHWAVHLIKNTTQLLPVDRDINLFKFLPGWKLPFSDVCSDLWLGTILCHNAEQTW